MIMQSLLQAFYNAVSVLLVRRYLCDSSDVIRVLYPIIFTKFTRDGGERNRRQSTVLVVTTYLSQMFVLTLC